MVKKGGEMMGDDIADDGQTILSIVTTFHGLNKSNKIFWIMYI